MPPEPSSSDLVREFVIAGHGNLEKVKELLTQHPHLLNMATEWSPEDHETAIMAAAHAGSAQVAEYLLQHGAPLEICSAAMLGRRADVERLLDTDPSLIHAQGAHGIPLLAHAAFSGNVEVVRGLFERGARDGVSAALGNAVTKGHRVLVWWLVDHAHPNLAWRNFQGKTALAVAEERGYHDISKFLRERGAV